MKKTINTLLITVLFITNIRAQLFQIADTAINISSNGSGSLWMPNLGSGYLVNLGPNNCSSFLVNLDFKNTYTLIPSNALIQGIKLFTYQTAGSISINDSSVQLLKNGLPVGNVKNTLSVIYPGDSLSYGGPSDLWGHPWQPTDFNTNFGFKLKICNTTLTNGTFAINQPFSIRVYYTLPIYTSIKNCDLTYLDFTLSPNPANDCIKLNLNGEYNNELTYEIVNSEGKELDKGFINDNLTRIEFSNYPFGLYYISVKNKGKTTTKKVVKK